ncbi:MAG TPA: hypothetical protein VEB00_16355 [Clostridia bacterium]|nr:hypothetical protein [Clostridia bacterium]
MENLSKKIDNLSYSTIEHEIASFYDLGMVNSSSLPVTLREDESGTYYIDGTKKHGEFSIKITKQPDETYWLFVWLCNLKKHR